MKFYPYEEGGGAGEVLAMLNGGGAQKSIDVVCYTVYFSQIAGGCKKFQLFKRGGGRKKLYPVLRGGGRKSFGPAIFPFCSSPFPVINKDQFLNKHKRTNAKSLYEDDVTAFR